MNQSECMPDFVAVEAVPAVLIKKSISPRRSAIARGRMNPHYEMPELIERHVLRSLFTGRIDDNAAAVRVARVRQCRRIRIVEGKDLEIEVDQAQRRCAPKPGDTTSCNDRW